MSEASSRKQPLIRDAANQGERGICVERICHGCVRNIVENNIYSEWNSAACAYKQEFTTPSVCIDSFCCINSQHFTTIAEKSAVVVAEKNAFVRLKAGDIFDILKN